jgi:hypothetical protein
LCAGFLRARYYPDSKILNAKIKSGASFTWKSILAGVQMFRRSYIWQVGDGSHIDIWTNTWILSSSDGKVATQIGSCIFKGVEELISHIKREWDEEILKGNLSVLNINRILATPLSSNSMEDFVAWRYTKTSMFSIWSAYHGEWNHQFRNKVSHLQAPGQSSINPVWNILWKSLVQ